MKEEISSRREMLKKVGIAGVSVSTLGSGVASARRSPQQNRRDLLQDETELRGRERGQYISSVRSSDQFNAVKHAMIDDGYTPHMKRPSPTKGTVATTGNSAKQLVVPFKNHNGTDRTATAYGIQPAETSELTVLANLIQDGGILRQYISNSQIVSEVDDGVRIISFGAEGGKINA